MIRASPRPPHCFLHAGCWLLRRLLPCPGTQPPPFMRAYRRRVGRTTAEACLWLQRLSNPQRSSCPRVISQLRSGSGGRWYGGRRTTYSMYCMSSRAEPSPLLPLIQLIRRPGLHPGFPDQQIYRTSRLAAGPSFDQATVYCRTFDLGPNLSDEGEGLVSLSMLPLGFGGGGRNLWFGGRGD